VQQHRVDDAEDGRVRADAEREDEYDRRKKKRRFSQNAKRKTKIREKAAHAAILQTTQRKASKFTFCQRDRAGLNAGY
jgi:hypothetical protein